MMLQNMFAKSMAKVQEKEADKNPYVGAVVKKDESSVDLSSKAPSENEEDEGEKRPDTEIIVSDKVDMSQMFRGGAAKKISYRMDYVPLKLGVKINPEDKYYGEEAIESYKSKAANLNQAKLAQDYAEQKEKESKNKAPAIKSASDVTRESKQGLDLLKRSMSFAIN